MAASETISRLRSALLAALVAALIWVFAEGESLGTRTVVTTVSFPNDPGADVVLRPAAGFSGVVQVRLEGTTGTLDLAVSSVSRGVRLKPGALGVPNTPGEGAVELDKAIGSVLEGKGYSTTVLSVEPRQPIVRAEKLASREMPVRVQIDGDLALEAPATCEPATVTLRVPEREMALIPESATAVAVVSEQALRHLRGDGAKTVPAVVRPPEQAAFMDPVIVTPEQVTVTLRPRSKVETLTGMRLPVWVSMPADVDASKWSVEVLDKAIADVTLTGPSDEIQRIRSGQLAVKAIVELSAEDLAKEVATKQVSFPGLPPSVGVSAPTHAVRLKITPKDAKP